VREILCCADIFIHPSLREGLPVSLMEAMVEGLPCIVSKIRGNSDLIHDGEGGILVEKTYGDAISTLADSSLLRISMGRYNRQAILPFGREELLKMMESIYTEALDK
jgi:glycosyltransferase involved in cell wall biosynthesis